MHAYAIRKIRGPSSAWPRGCGDPDQHGDSVSVQRAVAVWLLTSAGAFSIVLADTAPGSGTPDPDQLMIRARKREHLQLLQCDHPNITPFPIIESPPGLDYRFRIVAPKTVVAQVLADMASRVDYSNFKNAAHARAEHTGQDLRHRQFKLTNCAAPVAPNAGSLDRSHRRAR